MKKRILSLILTVAMLLGICPVVLGNTPTQTLIEPLADYSMNNTSGRPAWSNNGWLQVLASATPPSHQSHGIAIIGYDVSEIYKTLAENPDYIVKSVKFKPYVGYYKSGASDLKINMYVVNSDWRSAVAANEYDRSFLPGYVADSGDVISYPEFGTPDLVIETDIADSSNYSQKKIGSMYYRSAELKEFDITNLFHIHKANNSGKENQDFFTFAFDLTTNSGTRTELHIPAMENTDGLGGCYYHTSGGYADLSELAAPPVIEVEYMKLGGLTEKVEPEIPSRPGDDLKISYSTPLENVKCMVQEVGTDIAEDVSDNVQFVGADLTVSYDFEPLKSYVVDIDVSDIYGQTLTKSYVITMEREVNDTVLAMSTNGGNFHDAALLTEGGVSTYSLNAAKNVFYKHGSNPNAFVLFKIPLKTPDEGSYVEKAVFRYTSDYKSPVANQRIFKFAGEDWHISIGDTTTVYDDAEVTAVMSDYEANKAGECYECKDVSGYYHYLVDITDYVNECIEAGQNNIYLGVTAEQTTAKVYVRGSTNQDITYTIAKNPIIGFAGKSATIDGETLTALSFDVLTTFEKDVFESAIILEDSSGNVIEDAIFEYLSGNVSLVSPVELTSGESYKLIIREGTEDVFGNVVEQEDSIVYEFNLNSDDESTKDVLRVNYNSKTSEVSIMYVSPYYQNHDVTVEIVSTSDGSTYYSKEIQTDKNGVICLENIGVNDEEGYVVCVTPKYGAGSEADVLNSGYTSYLWDIAAFSTNASEILEYLDLVCDAFGIEVGYKEYLSDFYDFCYKLAETRDNYTIGEYDAENISKLRKIFELVGLLTVGEDISGSTNSEDARILYDALMISVEDTYTKEKFEKTENEDKELFNCIYSQFITSEKSFDSIDDFVSLMEKIYNENKQNIVLAMFKNLTHISQTGELLTDADTVSVLEIGELVKEYEKLKSKTIVHEAIYQKEFASAENFVKELEKAIDRAKDEDEAPKKSQSNKGGSSGGGFSANAAAIGSSVKSVENAVSETKFDDLEGYEWAEHQINYLCKNGVISGKSDRIFDPAGSVLREEAVKMIIEAFDISQTGSNAGFDDVSKSAWYADYVSIAKNAGITNGVSPSLFGVGLSITRQDAAVMIYTALVKKGIAAEVGAAETSFSDASNIASYAKTAVEYMSSVGVIKGYNDGSFKPDKTISRAEFAVVIGKLCQSIYS